MTKPVVMISSSESAGQSPRRADSPPSAARSVGVAPSGPIGDVATPSRTQSSAATTASAAHTAIASPAPDNCTDTPATTGPMRNASCSADDDSAMAETSSSAERAIDGSTE